MLGQPVAGPTLGRDGKRLLGGLLGEIDVTKEADQGRQDAAPLAPEDVLDRCAVSTATSTSGRISTAPPSRTAGIRCATSSTSSRSEASNTK
jgi:Flp pilus assembly protein TadD